MSQASSDTKKMESVPPIPSSDVSKQDAAAPPGGFDRAVARKMSRVVKKSESFKGHTFVPKQPDKPGQVVLPETPKVKEGEPKPAEIPRDRTVSGTPFGTGKDIKVVDVAAPKEKPPPPVKAEPKEAPKEGIPDTSKAAPPPPPVPTAPAAAKPPPEAPPVKKEKEKVEGKAEAERQSHLGKLVDILWAEKMNKEEYGGVPGAEMRTRAALAEEEISERSVESEAESTEDEYGVKMTRKSADQILRHKGVLKYVSELRNQMERLQNQNSQLEDENNRLRKLLMGSAPEKVHRTITKAQRSREADVQAFAVLAASKFENTQRENKQLRKRLGKALRDNVRLALKVQLLLGNKTINIWELPRPQLTDTGAPRDLIPPIGTYWASTAGHLSSQQAVRNVAVSTVGLREDIEAQWISEAAGNKRMEKAAGRAYGKHGISLPSGTSYGGGESCRCFYALNILIDIFEDQIALHEETVWENRFNGLLSQRDKLINQVLALSDKLSEISAVISSDPFLAAKLPPGFQMKQQLEQASSAHEQRIILLRRLSSLENAYSVLEDQLAAERLISREWRPALTAIASEVSRVLSSYEFAVENQDCPITKSFATITKRMTPSGDEDRTLFDTVADAHAKKLLSDARKRIEADARRIEYFVERLAELETQLSMSKEVMNVVEKNSAAVSEPVPRDQQPAIFSKTQGSQERSLIIKRRGG